MACRKVVLKGPFYLRNKDNRKYPANIIQNATFGPEYLKQQFWKNETFMNRLENVTNTEEIENVLRNEIASLGMNMDNFHRYNFEKQEIEKIDASVAFNLILQLVKRNLNDRKKKKKNENKNTTKKHKLDNTPPPTSNKKVSVTKSNTNLNTGKRKTLTDVSVLMDNIHRDIVIQKEATLSNSLYDIMLPCNIDPENSYIPNFDTSCKGYEMYSMIHNVFEDFNFCVYNGSHKSSNQTVHRSSMSNLYFPSEVGMFVLFHGALIHSGAPSKPEKNINSFNYSADVRFHSYIQKEGGVLDSNNTSTVRRSERRTSLSRYKNHSKDPDAGSSMKFCENLMEIRKNTPRNFECQVCNNVLNSLISKYPIVNRNVSINMSILYDKACKLNPNHPSSEPMYIAGDLEKYGWVVYSGHQMKNVGSSKKIELREELMNFIHSCGKKDWREPQANRLVRTIDTHEIKKLGKIDRIREFYDHMLEDCLRKIPLFGNAIMTERYIIRNSGLTLEQKPHRDFEYKEKNT